MYHLVWKMQSLLLLIFPKCIPGIGKWMVRCPLDACTYLVLTYAYSHTVCLGWQFLLPSYPTKMRWYGGATILPTPEVAISLNLSSMVSCVAWPPMIIFHTITIHKLSLYSPKLSQPGQDWPHLDIRSYPIIAWSSVCPTISDHYSAFHHNCHEFWTMLFWVLSWITLLNAQELFVYSYVA